VEVLQTVAARRIESTKHSSIVASSKPRWRCLSRRCRATLFGSPSERQVCATSGKPPKAVRVSAAGS
jgi:hypothetical protein